MSGSGGKRILRPSNGRKQRKAWNNTREKYMPIKRRHNLAETDRGLYYNKEEWLEEFLDGKGALNNGSKSDGRDNDENCNENNDQHSYWRVLPIVATK